MPDSHERLHCSAIDSMHADTLRPLCATEQKTTERKEKNIQIIYVIKSVHASRWLFNLFYPSKQQRTRKLFPPYVVSIAIFILYHYLLVENTSSALTES